MKLIIGLGNPGTEYQNNRHNIGQMFVDWLNNHPESTSEYDLKAVKTSVFMNQSGAEVKKLLRFYNLPLSELIIIHDDLDIQLGEVKIQARGGPKLHNGINSIERALKTKKFWRVRIGVDNRDIHHRIEGEKYVLQNFTPQEKENLPAIFKKAVDKLRIFFHNKLIK
jgi:PTH1 family peptidyl-tRNA hydrolase